MVVDVALSAPASAGACSLAVSPAVVVAEAVALPFVAFVAFVALFVFDDDDDDLLLPLLSMKRLLWKVVRKDEMVGGGG